MTEYEKLSLEIQLAALRVEIMKFGSIETQDQKYKSKCYDLMLKNERHISKRLKVKSIAKL